MYFGVGNIFAREFLVWHTFRDFHITLLQAILFEPKNPWSSDEYVCISAGRCTLAFYEERAARAPGCDVSCHELSVKEEPSPNDKRRSTITPISKCSVEEMFVIEFEGSARCLISRKTLNQFKQSLLGDVIM